MAPSVPTGAWEPHPGVFLPASMQVLICPGSILAVGFVNKGVSILGFRCSPGEALLQLVLKRHEEDSGAILPSNSTQFPAAHVRAEETDQCPICQDMTGSSTFWVQKGILAWIVS